MIPAVRIEGLSKQYRIGAQEHAAYRTLRESISSVAAAPWRRWRAKQNAKSAAGVNSAPLHNGESHRQNGHSLVNGDISGDTFWALDDVSFDVAHGEVVGIIGRNGAGKSTLLKILSRITEPTKGRVTINGRVASLLEVGTGFHPELTGRENVYLNGVMLGMKRREIDRTFDAIVGFSGVEKFLDTPVKRYSSGMYVRLAFAVAAHLEPEILIVDEVLAVGDAEFQKKCLGKMQDVARGGRTVLFVSHNMHAVRLLCNHCYVLEKGRLTIQGSTNAVLTGYLTDSTLSTSSIQNLAEYPRTSPSIGARLTSVEFFDQCGNPVSEIDRTSELTVRATLEATQRFTSLDIAMAVVHVDGQRICSEVYSDKFDSLSLPPATYTFEFKIPMTFFKIDSFTLSLCVFEHSKILDNIDGIPLPTLRDPSATTFIEERRWGYVRVPITWKPMTPGK
jgi:lipopolysaccharide transport system ATP-binding protein